MGEILIDNETLSLTYLRSDRLIELQWKLKGNSEEFKNSFLVSADFAKKNKVEYFLSDIRNEGLVDIEDLRWLEHEILPQAVELGVKRIALVAEDNLYSNLYAETLKKKIERLPISVGLFKDLNSARAWVLK